MTGLINEIAAFSATAPFPVILLAKATLLFTLGAVVAVALREASASVRYAVWALTLAAALALPLGMIATPALRIVIAEPLSAATRAIAPEEKTGVDITTIGPASAAVENGEATVTSTPETPGQAMMTGAAGIADNPVIWIPALWLLGMLAVIARMMIGRAALESIARRARPVPEWTEEIGRETRLAGVTKDVRVLLSDEVITPLTARTTAPLILLPADARQWDAEHRQVVLRHELAHIASHDAAVCAIAGVTCAFYWFHPLAWMAAHRLRTEQERACDDRVLALGTSGADYATHLLEVARTAQSRGIDGFVSMAMARPSQLEGRLLAILSATRRRAGLGPRGRIAAGVIALSSLAIVSAIRPVIGAAAIVVASQGDARFLSFPPVAAIAIPAVVQIVDSVITREIPVETGGDERQSLARGTVTLDLRTGASVTVTSWDQPRLRMRASLGGRDWRDTRLNFEPDRHGAKITTYHRHPGGSHTTSHRIELMVPRRFNVRLNSAGGGVRITNVWGEFTGTIGGGEIRIDRARGHADLSTGGGPVEVTRSTLSGSVSTGGGGVLIQDVDGGLRGSSGTGNVLYGEKGMTYSRGSSDGVRRASDGRLFVRKSGGSVSLAEAPRGASVSTGGGEITIGRAGGEVDAHTGGGDISIGPLTGSAEAHTGAGDVSIRIDSDDPGDIDITSGNGTVTLYVPRGLSANLDLETAYTNRRGRPTRIESDWPLSISETREWDSTHGTPRRFVRANQRVGRGGRTIRVRTVNGNIVIRRQ